ncbi:unnamed protein product [Didymodactylos carnosus]|uniref:Uncharacterized protein n=1 Tax=Didymodactylos carnosus TaxID=1234261 RepID=A0A816ED83_9BILA|nr:unnamed protein product [Didymodactylos carnosus]CAF4566018.1 unnamed protein product [Didymodactylos carnosus]
MTTLPSSSTSPEQTKYNLSVRRSSTPLIPSIHETVFKRSESVATNENDIEKHWSMKESEQSAIVKKKVDDNNSVKVSQLIAHYTTTSANVLKHNMNNNIFHTVK